MTAPDPQIITSRLWTFVQLTSASAFFPRLVEGAALSQGVAYTPGLLSWVASRPEVTGAITLTLDEGGMTSPVDAVLADLIVTAGQDVDAVIGAAVASYQET